MKLVKPPYLVRKLYSSMVWRFPSNEKKIFLTFDDGPIPEITPWVLKTLKEYNARATFFCVGQNVEKHPEIYKQIIADGHAVGNHTYSHLNGWKTKNEKYFNDIKKCATVVDSKLFRPPYGRIKKSQISNLNSKFSFIMWDVLSYDFDKSTSPEQCYNNVIKHTKPGSIIVFHDSIKAKNNLFSTLPKVLEYFVFKGYKFDVIPL